MFKIFLWRDMRIMARNSGDIIVIIGFFLMGVSLFGIALNEIGDAMLKQAAAAIIWLLLLLAVMLGQEKIFIPDKRSGLLADMATRRLLAPYLWAKIVTFYSMLCVPLLCLTLPAFMLLRQPLQPLSVALAMGIIALALVSLTLLVVWGAALVLTARTAHLLLPLLLLPLTVPLLIFAHSALIQALAGHWHHAAVVFLLGYALLNSVLCPYAAMALLKHNCGQ